MFDTVFNDKQWKAARDKTGLKIGLTEKVSMGDEFKRFQKDKSILAAKVLLQKIELYEKQLKSKHAKEKYYANLLKVVQGQKTAIETDIQAAENSVGNDNQKKPELDKDMDDFLEGIVKKQAKENEEMFANPDNDPNVANLMGKSQVAYLKAIKEFKTISEKMKNERVAMTELLQKCKALETNPNLKVKPEVAAAVAQKIVETLDKIDVKTTDLFIDFKAEGRVTRDLESPQSGAVKELDRMLKVVEGEKDQVVKIGDACRASLRNALQSLGNHPKAQEVLKLVPA